MACAGDKQRRGYAAPAAVAPSRPGRCGPRGRQVHSGRGEASRATVLAGSPGAWLGQGGLLSWAPAGPARGLLPGRTPAALGPGRGPGEGGRGPGAGSEGALAPTPAPLLPAPLLPAPPPPPPPGRVLGLLSTPSCNRRVAKGRSERSK